MFWIHINGSGPGIYRNVDPDAGLASTPEFFLLCFFFKLPSFYREKLLK